MFEAVRSVEGFPCPNRQPRRRGTSFSRSDAPDMISDHSSRSVFRTRRGSVIPFAGESEFLLQFSERLADPARSINPNQSIMPPPGPILRVRRQKLMALPLVVAHRYVPGHLLHPGFIRIRRDPRGLKACRVTRRSFLRTSGARSRCFIRENGSEEKIGHGCAVAHSS